MTFDCHPDCIAGTLRPSHTHPGPCISWWLEPTVRARRPKCLLKMQWKQIKRIAEATSLYPFMYVFCLSACGPFHVTPLCSSLGTSKPYLSSFLPLCPSLPAPSKRRHLHSISNQTLLVCGSFCRSCSHFQGKIFTSSKSGGFLICAWFSTSYTMITTKCNLKIESHFIMVITMAATHQGLSYSKHFLLRILCTSSKIQCKIFNCPHSHMGDGCLSKTAWRWGWAVEFAPVSSHRAYAQSPLPH